MYGKGRACLMALSVVASIFAQSVNLSGTVTNKSGKPIAGATVKLVVKNIITQTDANGKYSITSTFSEKSSFLRLPSTDHVSMERGVVSLSVSKTSDITIDLFDMMGKRAERMVRNIVDPGSYRFNLLGHPFAAGVMLVRVSVGGHSSTFRYFPERLANKGSFSSNRVAILSRRDDVGSSARLEAIVDTLKVSATNYMEYSEALSSLQGVKNITLDSIALPKFSFFVTSLKALQELSGSENGFGGDFRFGKTGEGAGLLGADSICQCIAERSMPGSKVKQWRAFLSATKGPDGKQVNAIDRIGKGPWYDRRGRLLANNISELLNTRPINADPVIKNDLPNEDGVPNHYPDPNQPNQAVDN
ncbi:MAG: carboxypeptidase-like regulatory domain-containing protein, partial [Chitinispirillaceae bacterium]|nr:carboxypeptidase-like regulatory domain-containing protein [Chitinispirillaceae bacterium]